MVHELSLYSDELPAIEDWYAGDDRTLAFQVVDSDGNGVDISGATITWRLYRREYQTGTADAILDESDSGVEIVTDSRVDTSVGEFEVRLDSSATESLNKVYFHRPSVEQSDGSTASWRGRVVIEA